ncbi:MAG TPA: hypothetical protein VLA61_21105 [Ideonella sp.]|uniref:hypothetical protein n=1 Tax=Ideonella sp. TaxID=1929293 RepID=UPI002B7781B1|nr:hypothetical protein [Ideonella sp.]HSI50775.1 hypothetical protein [Ideonella sp.]
MTQAPPPADLTEAFLLSLRRRRLVVAMAAAGMGMAACGGGGDAGSPAPLPPSPPPPPPPPPPPSPPVSGPAWWNFGRDSQHSGEGAIATQDLNRIAWSTPVDLMPQYQGETLLVHYGSPVITSNNTVLVPVKTQATSGFRVEARSGATGTLLWSADTDYAVPAHHWMPGFHLALSRSNRLFVPGAGGKVYVRDAADSAQGALQPLVFYGSAAYAAASAQLDAAVFINTPITVDAAGNAFFGFVANAGNPAGLVSGFARLGADGSGLWIAAADVSGDASVVKPAMNCAPALSPDLATVYVLANAVSAGWSQHGVLLALDSTTLAPRARVALLDPQTGDPAQVSDDSTASPTVGTDGDVYIGVLESSQGQHNYRGWLLHFDSTLATTKVPGSFGWDDTASLVPASIVGGYTGSSSYLLAVKYNNYLNAGTGDGLNRMAVLDPNATQVDPISGEPVMREVITVLGVTPENPGSAAVKEWCVNTVAVDPLTHSLLVNSEDGVLYRWDLASNTLSQRIRLTGGLGEAYTPTAIGADGAVYAINRSTLFSIAG